MFDLQIILITIVAALIIDYFYGWGKFRPFWRPNLQIILILHFFYPLWKRRFIHHFYDVLIIYHHVIRIIRHQNIYRCRKGRLLLLLFLMKICIFWFSRQSDFSYCEIIFKTWVIVFQLFFVTTFIPIIFLNAPLSCIDLVTSFFNARVTR